MAAMKPRTGDGPLEVTKEGRGIVMRVPLEGGGRLVVELNAEEAGVPRAPASSALSSTTRRPPPSSGTRITMPRPSLVTSSGPSPVRGFIAAIRAPLPVAVLERARSERPRTPYARPLSPMSPVTRTTGAYRGPRRVDAGWQTPSMHARSALFDVYGDHLRARGNQAPVAALVRLLDPVGHRRAGRAHRDLADGHAGLAGAGPRSTAAAATAPPSGRSAGSTRRPTGSTARTERALGRPLAPASFVDPAARPRARAPGCAPTWPSWGTPSSPTASGSARSPAPSSTSLLERAGGAGPRPPGPSTSTRRRSSAWDLGAPARGVRATGWTTADDLVADRSWPPTTTTDEAAFAARFQLVHEWRKFLFADPGLPAELLPARLAGPARPPSCSPARRRGSSPARTGSWRAAWTPDRPAIRQTASMTDVHPSPSDQPVLLDVADGVATITLNRPDAMNSLDVATKELLLDDRARRWPTTRPRAASC